MKNYLYGAAIILCVCASIYLLVSTFRKDEYAEVTAKVYTDNKELVFKFKASSVEGVLNDISTLDTLYGEQLQDRWW